MRLHDVLGDRQTQPGPHRTSRAIRLVKPLEEAGKLARTYTDAGILNLEFDSSIDRGGDHLDRAPAWGELDRVVDQIEEHLIHPARSAVTIGVSGATEKSTFNPARSVCGAMR